MSKLSERLESGILLIDAKKNAEEFLEWWESYMRKTEPYALKTISAIENVLMSFPSDEEMKGKIA